MITSQELDVFSCGLDGINQIEASAGTGKTWNMCGLYLRLLLERRLPVQQILVVTFTNAATAELRERIRSRIVDTLRYLANTGTASVDPFVATLVATMTARDIPRTTMHDLLALALQTFDEAAIFTIHGFCQRALADSPFAAGMPFSTELLADDDEMAMRAVHDYWRQHISSGELNAELLAHLIMRNDSPEKFATLLQRQQAKTQARTIWPDDIDTPFCSNKIELDQAFDAAAQCWGTSAQDIRDLIEKNIGELNGVSYKPDAIAKAWSEWDEGLRGNDTMAFVDTSDSKFRLLTATRLATGTKSKKTTPRHAFFDLAQTLADLTAAVALNLDLARLNLIRDLLTQCASTLRQHKREQRIQSYDDILYNVYAALHSDATPWLAGALLTRYPAALIDEFQDTDPLQFAIFDAIYGAGDNPLFLVGDPKQAIYSFRNADLHTYLRARDKATMLYSLADNQRSCKGLIDAQNALFKANAKAFILPGLDYHDVRFGSKPRTPFADSSAPGAALQVWTLPVDDDNNLLGSGPAQKAVSRATAAEIARLLTAAQAGQVQLGDRPLQAGDIAVLVKSHVQGSAIRHALGALAIGSVELSQANIFRSVDAGELERLLSAIANPTNTGLLLAALSTQLLGYDAAAIESIGDDEAALQKQIENFSAYRALWLERGVGFMYRRLLTDENVSKRMLARTDGERRMTNLLHLGEYLHQAGDTHPAPEALLRWLATQRAGTNGDDAAQLRLESDQNLVQIVTIHRSKGLEYPVVFCPFLWSGRLHRGGEHPEGSAYHDEHGDSVIDFRPAPHNQSEIKESIKQETAAEFLRLTYVALTRAAHRCYLVAGCYNTSSFGRPSSTESTRSLLNWLVAGDGIGSEDWAKHRMMPAEIAAKWTALAATCTPHIDIQPLPDGCGTPVRSARASADSLAPHRLPPPLRDGWRMTSFSALHYATSAEVGANDHDARSTGWTRRAQPVPATIADDDILRFARGPSAGDTLHAILDGLDFTDPAGWTKRIAHGLQSHPQNLPGIAADQQLPLQTAMVHSMLTHMTDTTLTDGVRLSAVAPDHCLSELEFNLPAPHLQADVLNDLLAQAGYAVPELEFKKMEGYLKGFIDLVFESNGRYYLLDWKSNHLGYQPEDYDAAGMEAAMAEHGYHLQYLLYAVALHRYLGQRVPHYQYDTQFGGVLYLFMRAVRPDWTDATGAARGVYFHKPQRALIDALDRLFTARAATNINRSAA